MCPECESAVRKDREEEVGEYNRKVQAWRDKKARYDLVLLLARQIISAPSPHYGEEGKNATEKADSVVRFAEALADRLGPVPESPQFTAYEGPGPQLVPGSRVLPHGQ